MKTLLIPDLHHRFAWVAPVVADERPDRIVFLGDGCDAKGRWGRGYTACAGFIAFAKEWLSRPEVIWLVGNHEAHYIFNHTEIRGGGWKHWRWKRYAQELGWVWWPKMRLAHWEQGWLLSHAGFRAELAHPYHGLTEAWLTLYEREMFEAARLGPTSWTTIGDARLRQPNGSKGGVTWLDWNREFQPIEGVNQIVGHTEDDAPRWKTTDTSRNLCLDTGCRHYALIVDGAVVVKPQPYPLVADPRQAQLVSA